MKRLFLFANRAVVLIVIVLTLIACDDNPVAIEKEVDPIIKRDTIYLPKPDTTYLTRIDTTYIQAIDTFDARRIDTIITKKNDAVFIIYGFDNLGNPGNYASDLKIEMLQEYANCDTIENIYLVPSSQEDWYGYGTRYIPQLRAFLQPRIELSPKMHGRGDFPFLRSAPSEIPEDSLWFVQNGWTINKQK